MSVDTSPVHPIRNDPALPPIAVQEPPSRSPVSRGIFVAIAVVATAGWAMVAIVRGERVNAVWLVLAAVGSYLIALRFYARFIEDRVLQTRDTRMTPAEEFENGKDFVPTDRRVLFGHHFAAIAGAGPLVGPVLAAQMGYLPGTLWIILGVIFAGAVQDYMVLHLSIRRRGRSLGQMARDELGRVGGWAALLGVLSIMIILIAVLGLVVVGALAQSPWGVYSIAMTIPIALFMGVYLRFLRPGKVGEVSVIGVTLLLFAVISGQWVSESSWGSAFFTLSPTALALWLCLYGFAASVLPVWLLLAPRDYLSTFMKVGTICVLAIGILVTAPVITMPALTQFGRDGTGPAFAGALFPFLFITIACGAISGFHSLIASGTTPKLIEKESQARIIGYGGMLTESFVAIMALITAVILDQHLYFVMNAPAGATGGTAETAATWVNSLPLTSPGGVPLDPTTPQAISDAATAVGEKTIVSRTGGAPTLAVGMSEVMSFLGGASMKAFWYHFAVMFEALFILTTVDAGTRVARFMLSDLVSNVPGLSRFKDPSWRVGTWLCSLLIVLGWGSILVMGVTDPLGGINTLFPLFGIANQLLAAMALTIVTTVLFKKAQFRYVWVPGAPLLWVLTVTMTASWQKIFSSDPKIGYWSNHQAFVDARNAGKTSFGTATNVAQMDAVIRNTAIQTGLSILFATLVAVVFVTGVVVSVKALRAGGLPTSEDPDQPSRIFAPRSFVPTSAERQVLAEWKAAGLDPTPVGAHHP
ncbi:MAG: carbon starvation CstA family protein [Dermatophilaceae bacterium]